MSQIEIHDGDLLQAPAEALVNAVNCVGVMGKGIALQFRRTFPEIMPPYVKACRAGQLRPGQLLVVEIQAPQRPLPLCVINVATKDHWRGASKIEWVEAGLARLVEEVRARKLRSVAVPPLGCGHGGLDWNTVRPLIENAFATVPDVRVLLYAPQTQPEK